MYTLFMRKIPLVQGEYYHLYGRGVDKRVVFTEPSEYERFIAYLYILNSAQNSRHSDFFRTHTSQDAFNIDRGDPLVAFGAFCLMPNHFHLYVTPLVEGGVSKFMQRLQTAYTKYFNQKHARTGALFGSTFKSEHVKNDNHAKYLFSYIHLNPAKLKDPRWKEKGSGDLKKLAAFVEEYPYSSYREYLSGDHVITAPAKFPEYLHNKSEVQRHIKDWLQFQDPA